MDDSANQNKTPLYGAIFALVIYFGAIGPWQDELTELQAQVERDTKAAANPARLLNKARRSQKSLAAKRTRLTNILSNLPPADHGENNQLTAADMFAIVVAAANRHRLPSPDIRPLSPVTNQFFSGEGCTFEIVARKEQDIYRFLHTLESDVTKPRVRSITIDSRPLKNELVARISLAWVRFQPAGVTAVKGVTTTSTTIPPVKTINQWALFAPRPTIVTPRTSNRKATGTKGSARSAAQTTNATAPPATVAAKAPPTSQPAPPSLGAVELIGTITIGDTDGVILPMGGAQKLLMVGEEFRGFTLEEVSAERAVFRHGMRRAVVPLKRKSLLDDSATSSTNKPTGTAEKEEKALQLPERKKLGLRAVFVSASRIDGGKALSQDGYRRGMLVRSVADDSLAADLRFEERDLIFKIDDKAIRTPTQLRVAADKVSRGERVSFALLRRGVRMNIASVP